MKFSIRNNNQNAIEIVYSIITNSEYLDYVSYLDELTHLNYLAKSIISSVQYVDSTSLFIKRNYFDGTDNKKIFLKKMEIRYMGYKNHIKFQILNVKNEGGLYKYNVLIKFDNLLRQNNIPNYNMIHEVVQDFLELNTLIFVCDKHVINRLIKNNISLHDIFDLNAKLDKTIPIVIQMKNDDTGTSLYCRFNNPEYQNNIPGFNSQF